MLRTTYWYFKPLGKYHTLHTYLLLPPTYFILFPPAESKAARLQATLHRPSQFQKHTSTMAWCVVATSLYRRSR